MTGVVGAELRVNSHLRHLHTRAKENHATISWIPRSVTHRDVVHPYKGMRGELFPLAGGDLDLGRKAKGIGE